LLFGKAPPGRFRRKHLPAKDYMRENRKLIRETEKVNKELQQRQLDEKTENLRHLKEFADVKARCFQITSAAEKKAFLKKHARDTQKKPIDLFKTLARPEPFPETTDTKTPRKAPLPHFDEEPQQKPPREAPDFLARNKRLLSEASTSVRKISSPVERESKHDDFGTLPAYLVERKMELAEKARLKREEQLDPAAPPGTKAMDQSERRKMLATLREQKAKVDEALNKLPLHLTTLKQKKQAADLEAKLKQVEASIAIFDKPTVYVKAG